MSEKIRLTWEVSDGYAGGSRPHSFRINPSDYEDMDKREIEQVLHEEIQQDFESKVSWICNVSEYADEILKALESSPEEGEQ